MNENTNQLIEYAKNAITAGVKVLQSIDAVDGRTSIEIGRDIKLEADFLLSREITTRLYKTTNIRCISEEDLKSCSFPGKEPVWIVDPLDGSMNFSRGVPLYCVSVALWQAKEPVVGIIYDISRNRMLSAGNTTALADGKAIHVRNTAQMNKAVLATGFPLLSDVSPKAISWFLKFAEQFKKVRMLGTAALSMAWVAEGRLDAYFEKDIMVWDVAAGAALVRSAGGVCLMRPGRHPMSMDVLAANPYLAKAMQEALEW